MVESTASDVTGNYNSFLARLDTSGRSNVDRHVAACEGEATREHLRLWKRLVGFLASLAPHSIRTTGQRAVQFYVADGKYRLQVFALEDLRDGKLLLYAPDGVERAVQAGLLRPAADTAQRATVYQLGDSADQHLHIELLTAAATTSAPDYYRHLLDWNRKAVRITLPTNASPAQVHAAEMLCAIAHDKK